MYWFPALIYGTFYPSSFYNSIVFTCIVSVSFAALLLMCSCLRYVLFNKLQELRGTVVVTASATRHHLRTIQTITEMFMFGQLGCGAPSLNIKGADYKSAYLLTLLRQEQVVYSDSFLGPKYKSCASFILNNFITRVLLSSSCIMW